MRVRLYLHALRGGRRPNTSRFVGAHKGPVSAICTPRKGDGQLGKAGLIVTGSVDSSIKIWDYQGKVILDPTVRVCRFAGPWGSGHHRRLATVGRNEKATRRVPGAAALRAR